MMTKPFAEVLPLRRWAHREHVGPMDELATPESGYPKDKPEHRAIVRKSPGRDAAEFLRHEEHRGGDLFGEAGAPSDLLERQAGGTISMGSERADQHNAK